LGTYFSNLKLHQDGQHQVNKLWIRVGSTSNLILKDQEEEIEIVHPGPAHMTLFFMSNWHLVPHYYKPCEDEKEDIDQYIFSSFLFKFNGDFNFDNWSIHTRKQSRFPNVRVIFNDRTKGDIRFAVKSIFNDQVNLDYIYTTYLSILANFIFTLISHLDVIYICYIEWKRKTYHVLATLTSFQDGFKDFLF